MLLLSFIEKRNFSQFCLFSGFSIWPRQNRYERLNERNPLITNSYRTINLFVKSHSTFISKQKRNFYRLSCRITLYFFHVQSIRVFFSFYFFAAAIEFHSSINIWTYESLQQLSLKLIFFFIYLSLFVRTTRNVPSRLAFLYI